jgi:hypothetical protein
VPNSKQQNSLQMAKGRLNFGRNSVIHVLWKVKNTLFFIGNFDHRHLANTNIHKSSNIFMSGCALKLKFIPVVPSWNIILNKPH